MPNDLHLGICQWPDCPLEATCHVYYGFEHIHVCKAHRGAVQVNIESCDKIWIFEQKKLENANKPTMRPGEGQPRYRGVVSPDKPAKVPDSLQEAAKKADAAAVPVDPVADLVQPRRRTEADKSIGDILKGVLRPGGQ